MVSRIVNEDKIVAWFKQANINIGNVLQILDYDSKLDLFYIMNITRDTAAEVSGMITQ